MVNVMRVTIVEPEHEVKAFIYREGKDPVKVEKKGGGIYYAEVSDRAGSNPD